MMTIGSHEAPMRIRRLFLAQFARRVGKGAVRRFVHVPLRRKPSFVPVLTQPASR